MIYGLSNRIMGSNQARTSEFRSIYIQSKNLLRWTRLENRNKHTEYFNGVCEILNLHCVFVGTTVQAFSFWKPVLCSKTPA